MPTKPIFIGVAMTLLFILTTAMTEDCHTPFHLTVVDAQEQLEDDMAYCDNNAFPFMGKCENEAGAAFDATIDQAIKDYIACCCRNGLICCHN